MQLQRRVRAASLHNGSWVYSRWAVVTYEPRKRKRDARWIWWTKSQSAAMTIAQLKAKFGESLHIGTAFRKPLDVSELLRLRDELQSEEERQQITVFLVTQRLAAPCESRSR